MSITDIAAGVLMGNLMTLSVFYSLRQFMTHDKNAPWVAYGGFLLPLGYIALALI